MHGIDAHARFAHTIVDDDPHQLGQRGGTVGRGAQGRRIRRHQRIERVAHLLPLAVDFQETLHFQQVGDTAVLRMLAVRIEQPFIDFLAFLLAGRHHLRQGGAFVLAQIRHHPQFQRMHIGQITAVGQGPVFHRVLLVHLGDALGRHFVLRRQVGVEEIAEFRHRAFRIDGTEDICQAHGGRADAGQQNLFLLVDALAAILLIEAVQEFAPFLVGKTAQVLGAARIVRVRQQGGRGIGTREHVVAGHVAHQAHEHQVGRLAQRLLHRHDAAVVKLGEVAEMMQAAAREEAFTRIARILALHGGRQHGGQVARLAQRQWFQVGNSPLRQHVLRIDGDFTQFGGAHAAVALVQLVDDVQIRDQGAQLGRRTEVQLGALVDVERLVKIVRLHAQQVGLIALLQQGKTVDHVGRVAIAQHALARQAGRFRHFRVAQLAQDLGDGILRLRVERADHFQVQAVEVVQARVAEHAGQMVAHGIRGLTRDERGRCFRLHARGRRRAQLLGNGRIAQLR